jgi:hypothetical protein
VLYAIEALYVLGMGALLVVFDAAMTRFEGEPVEASSVLDDVAVVAFLVVGLTAGCYATTKVGKVMPWFVRAGALAATAAINALGACSFGRDLVHGLLNPVEFQSLGFGAGDLLGDAAVLVGCLVLGTHAALLACADVTAWRQRVPAT